MVRYLFRARKTSDLKTLVNTFHNYLSPKLEETVMTIAQQLKAEGRQEVTEELTMRLLQINKLSLEQIVETTGLSKEAILNLLADKNKVKNKVN